nr:family 16 glycosylhydrolase [Streptacidiphilus rugosus]
MWRPGWFGSTVSGPVNSNETQRYNSTNVTVSGGNLNLALTSNYGALVSTNPHDGRPSGGYEFTGPAVMEARIYTPGTTSVDNWPAFWSDGQNWPADGEIDAMEGLGGQLCYHVHDNAGGPGGCTALSPGWHTYGAYWDSTAQVVTFYYDGVQVGSEPFQNAGSPQYLILDNTSASSPVPGTMLVDWVRVWQPS